MALPSRAIIPIQEYVCLYSAGAILRVTGIGPEIGVMAEIKPEYYGGSGTYIMPPSLVLPVLAGLGDTEITLEKGKILWPGGSLKYGVVDDTYPEFPSFASEKMATVKSEDFQEAIEAVAPSTLPGDTGYAYVWYDNTAVTMYGGQYHSISEKTMEMDATDNTDPLHIALSRLAIQAITKALAGDHITIRADGPRMILSADSGAVSVLQPSMSMPDFKTIISKIRTDPDYKDSQIDLVWLLRIARQGISSFGQDAMMTIYSEEDKVTVVIHALLDNERVLRHEVARVDGHKFEMCVKCAQIIHHLGQGNTMLVKDKPGSPVIITGENYTGIFTTIYGGNKAA